MFVLEHERASRENGLENDRTIVYEFRKIAATLQTCSLVVWNGKFLRNRTAFGMNHRTGFNQLTLSKANLGELVKSCTSHGHLSVLFFSPDCEEISRCFLKLGFFDEPKPVRFEVPGTAMDPESFQFLESFLASARGQ